MRGLMRGLMRCAAVCLVVLVGVAVGAREGMAQSAGPNDTRSTSAGVYTADQAARGRDMYAMQCKSCHTPASHTGVVFANSWDRRPLSDLYRFIVTRMPKNEPGSLQPDEYADVLAYLLKLNDLPSGSEPLPADSVALKKIRIEVGKKEP
jgi:mono/diheme cytochrome c family protein